MTEPTLFLGIDPGKNGGAGVLDVAGAFVDAWRWKEEDPLNTWFKLSSYVGKVIKVYIERVNLFRELEIDQILRMAPMIANSAKWEMMLTILQINPVKVMPRSWQGKIGLAGYKQTKAKFTTHSGKELLLTPYNLARHLWPMAPMKTQADDGMAVGLLLAEVARQDALKGTCLQSSTNDPLRRRSRHDIAPGNRKACPKGKVTRSGALMQPLFETRMDKGD